MSIIDNVATLFSHNQHEINDSVLKIYNRKPVSAFEFNRREIDAVGFNLKLRCSVTANLAFPKTGY